MQIGVYYKQDSPYTFMLGDSLVTCALTGIYITYIIS